MMLASMICYARAEGQISIFSDKDAENDDPTAHLRNGASPKRGAKSWRDGVSWFAVVKLLQIST
jgi:hypothetical protein